MYLFSLLRHRWCHGTHRLSRLRATNCTTGSQTILPKGLLTLSTEWRSESPSDLCTELLLMWMEQRCQWGREGSRVSHLHSCPFPVACQRECVISSERASQCCTVRLWRLVLLTPLLPPADYIKIDIMAVHSDYYYNKFSILWKNLFSALPEHLLKDPGPAARFSQQ